MNNLNLPKKSYTEIYAEALTRPRHEIQDLRLEILESYERIREQVKILEVYLHALGDAGMKR